MASKVLTFILTVLLFIPAPAQDNLVEIDELYFQSDFEKKVLTGYFNTKDAEGFYLLMSGGSLLTDVKVEESKKRFYEHLEAYKDEKINSKKNDKKARLIYDGIHKSFLKKYDDGSTFEEIFYNGNYNSITATALYALAFKDLGAPYIIKEDPSQVYLIVYPDQERIKIESTSPVQGVVALNTAFKQQFLKTLREQKFISSQEFNARSQDELFDKYYFASHQDISIPNLVGIQYMKSALEKYEQKKFADSHAQMEKAYLLFPSQRIAYLLMVSGSGALEARAQKDSIHASLLGKLSRFKEFGVTNDIVVSEFARALHHLLFEMGRKDDALKYHRVLASKVRDEGLQEEINFVYNFEAARLAYNQARFKESVKFFENALHVKPQNLETGNALIGALAQSFSSSGSNLDHLSILEDYAARFPSLQQNNIFNNLLATAYLIQSGYEYDNEKPSAGEKYRLQFEDFVKKYPDLPLNSQLVGHTYSRSAIYYFRKGQTAKAKAVIESGLALSPGNFELMSRKQMIR